MIRFLIWIYIWIILVDVFLHYLPQFQRTTWAKTIKKLADYTLNPVRKILPEDLPFDFSPMVVIIILMLIPALW